MRLKIHRQIEDDERLGLTQGDLILVDLDCNYDPEKAIGVSILKLGSAPGCSFYKSALNLVHFDDCGEYLNQQYKEKDPAP